MIHKNRDDFVRTLKQVAMQTGFLLPLIEKDYYLTLMLSHLNKRKNFNLDVALERINNELSDL